MFFKKKEEVSVEEFWRNYENAIGEKVVAKSLAQYIGGWAEYDESLWGLIIATAGKEPPAGDTEPAAARPAENSGGFRFHHFPHEGWIAALARISSGGEGPKEKTFFIPREAISSVELVIEKHWWKKILSPSRPLLVIRCRVNGIETEVKFEAEESAQAIVDALET